MFEIKGKVAMVAGGANGIGFCIAKKLLEKEAKGVAILDINDRDGTSAADKLEESVKNRIIFVKTDVTERSQFENAFEETIRVFNQIDIVVNCAGIIQEINWEKCIAVNLQGCLTGSLLALNTYFSKYLGGSQGLIVNVASLAGLIPFPALPVYSATKYGIVGFTRSLGALERCGNKNVKIIAICPGNTNTGIRKITSDQITSEGYKLLPLNPKGRFFQETDDVADHAMAIMEEGRSGSVWLIEDNVKKEIEFSDFVIRQTTASCRKNDTAYSDLSAQNPTMHLNVDKPPK